MSDLGGQADETAGQGGRQCLAADEDAQPPDRVGDPGHEAGPQGGGRLDGGDSLPSDQPAESVRLAHLVGRGEDDRGAVEQRQEQLQMGDVEGHGRHGEQAVGGAERQPVPHGGQQMGEIAVGDHDPFGRPVEPEV